LRNNTGELEHRKRKVEGRRGREKEEGRREQGNNHRLNLERRHDRIVASQATEGIWRGKDSGKG